MRGFCVATWAVVPVLVLLTVPSPAASQNSWTDLLPPIMSLFTSLWQNKEMDFMGYTCYYFQRPLIRQWQLYYEGSLSCPSWSSVIGEANTRSRAGVMTNTFKNYLNKVKAAGLITEEEASGWLKSHSGGEGDDQELGVRQEGLERRERATWVV